MTDKEGKKKKALRLLTKLLKASKKAQSEGKNLALEKIISEANRISSKIDKGNKLSPEEIKAVYGEIVPEQETQILSSHARKIEIEEDPDEILQTRKENLKAEHSNLAIIAAKQDFLGGD